MRPTLNTWKIQLALKEQYESKAYFEAIIMENTEDGNIFGVLHAAEQLKLIDSAITAFESALAPIAPLLQGLN